MPLRAFVAMPFGTKPGKDGNNIDFNRVYHDLIAPALGEAGLNVLRADEEQQAGDIRTDMFQELLIADLVIVDLTVDNPNVWYELGVRHALRSRGVVLLCGDHTTSAFDVYTDRKLRYNIKEGGPDPTTLEQDRKALTAMVRATMESWHGKKISPVYQLMPNLQEPDWRSLRIGSVKEFWEQHDAWETRIALARKNKRIGDLLVLADEGPIAAFRAEAWIRAGEALRKAEHFKFALEQLERGLNIEPNNLKGLREKGICLQRLAMSKSSGHSLDKARTHYQNVLKKFPNDPETWALLGRVDKDAWTESWNRADISPERMREEAAYEDALLREAIESYTQGFRCDTRHYYSGINSLTLMYLYRHLTEDTRYDNDINIMAGAIRFAAENEQDINEHFWSKATLGDLEVLTGTPESAQAAYKGAIAKSGRDWFALNSTRAQLQMLKNLGFRPENVDAGISTFNRALRKLSKPEDMWKPRQVFLFSGHMIDAHDRATPRFPGDKESIAREKISDVLDRLGAGPDDVALTQGACGGDLLFTESCQDRGVKVRWLQPFLEPEFLEKSVLRGGDSWQQRYMDSKSKLDAPILSAPTELGAPPAYAKSDYPYERCNLWLLYTAFAYGEDRVKFICLWNGEEEGDGSGGTAHLYKEVKRRTGNVYWIDTRGL